MILVDYTQIAIGSLMVGDYKRSNAHVAQQAEQGFCKPQVGSSILSMGSNIL